MDPTREPQSAAPDPSDDAVVAYLRQRAPGLPASTFDAGAVTAHARGALRRLRRRRLRNSIVAAAGATTVYVALAIAVGGPVTVPGLGTVNLPGGDALRGAVAGLIPGPPPGPGRWQDDVDRLETEVLPVVDRLGLSFYLLERGPCRILEYSRGSYRDGAPECGDLVPFDATARADFDEMTRAVERSGVPIERIGRHQGGIYVQLEDFSVQYNWAYAYLPGVSSPPPTQWPGEEWTHIRGNWWFHRAHDD
jgi:hypothetical protein